MSSLRNAVQRRQHRERAQPANREKWGLLEKHKDYSLRAADYNAKKAKLQRLREKARDRNPDEFAFGMVSTAGKKPGGKTVTQGRHGVRADASLSVETVRLLKTQDAGYLRVMGEKVRRELETVEREVRLQEGIKGVLDGGKAKSKTKTKTKTDGGKVVFVDSVEEQRRRAGLEESDEIDSDEEDDAEEAGRPAQGNNTTKKTKKQLEEEESLRREIRAAKRMKKRAAETRLRKLEALKKQHEDIVAAERELDWQRGRMDNAVGGVNKNGVKWKIRERKR